MAQRALVFILQGLKPAVFAAFFGTTEVVPCYKAEFFRSL
jgi:hypothetical protein